MRIKLDRSGKALLSNQLTEWLKASIRRGRFGQGAVLPGARELAAAANVGVKTATRALAVLAAEGWVVPKRHVGSVVIERGLPTLCRKRLLFFTEDPYYCYYHGQFFSSVRDQLLKSHVEISAALGCGCSVGDRFDQLKEFLKEKWNLVVAIGSLPRLYRALEASGWPFLSIADGRQVVHSRAENCLGTVDIGSGAALPDFTAACVRKGVRMVLQVQGLPDPYDAAEPLAACGIASRRVRVASRGLPITMTQGGYTAVREWFGDGGRRPDVILFTDDYVAQGGLLALKDMGMRIPEDVAVAAHANKGHAPFWGRPLTRLEMDPVAHGRVLAGAIAAYLRGEPFPRELRLGSVWREGETF